MLLIINEYSTDKFQFEANVSGKYSNYLRTHDAKREITPLTWKLTEDIYRVNTAHE